MMHWILAPYGKGLGGIGATTGPVWGSLGTHPGPQPSLCTERSGILVYPEAKTCKDDAISLGWLQSLHSLPPSRVPSFLLEPAIIYSQGFKVDLVLPGCQVMSFISIYDDAKP